MRDTDGMRNDLLGAGIGVMVVARLPDVGPFVSAQKRVTFEAAPDQRGWTKMSSSCVR